MAKHKICLLWKVILELFMIVVVNNTPIITATNITTTIVICLTCLYLVFLCAKQKMSILCQ